jgi:ketosteroid isomerase-like protein
MLRCLQVRVIGDAAILTYVRLTQKHVGGVHVTVATEETRVWEKKGGQWKLVHLHRSPCAAK